MGDGCADRVTGLSVNTQNGVLTQPFFYVISVLSQLIRLVCLIHRRSDDMSSVSRKGKGNDSVGLSGQTPYL